MASPADTDFCRNVVALDWHLRHGPGSPQWCRQEYSGSAFAGSRAVSCDVIIATGDRGVTWPEVMTEGGGLGAARRRRGPRARRPNWSGSTQNRWRTRPKWSRRGQALSLGYRCRPTGVKIPAGCVFHLVAEPPARFTTSARRFEAPADQQRLEPVAPVRSRPGSLRCCVRRGFGRSTDANNPGPSGGAVDAAGRIGQPARFMWLAKTPDI